MPDLQEFVNQDFGEVRGLNYQDMPWLVGKDVAVCLGYKNINRDIIRHVDEDDRLMLDKTQYQNGIEFDYHILGQRGGWIINESGLYSLIFGSELSTAKQFKHWVTSEVLPQIRQTGGYIAEDRESEFVEKYFPSFKDETKLSMVQDLLKTNKKYKAQIKSLQPKAEAYKDLMTAEGYVNFIDLASVVEIGRTKLLDFLRSEKVLTKQSQFNVPYGRFTKNGYFATIHEKGRDGKIGTVTMVSPRGIDYIYHLIKKRHKESDFDMRKVVA
ncbi:Phage antirepressor protein YoqD, KilAC domain [Ruminococcaceae bacterium BL-6]|nr:Phage antirepressor protein YoqD, KilAC domain [Ruminococcaceae bacterium BL-6]